jgi:Family of unknown function (DUF6932)
MQSVRWLIDAVRNEDILRVVINGSFVTDCPEPNDVDCLLLIGPTFPKDLTAEAELRAGVPFLDIELVNQEDFDWMIGTMFATDRSKILKGMIEVSYEH